MYFLSAENLRAIFPRAPQPILDAFFTKQDVLTGAGINSTQQRLAYFLANIEHESGGFTIKNLTENTNYTPQRMAEVWPNRFANAQAVINKYGNDEDWRKKAFDDIYGNRMGNRPDTSDGSLYIGRGGPQWTGRDGYAALEKLTGIPAVANPNLASSPELQPEICAAFWTWKGLNAKADAGDFNGLVRAWNGGTNGMADRLAMLKGNDPIVSRLTTTRIIANVVLDKPAIIPAPAPKLPEPPYSLLQAIISFVAGLFKKKS